MLEKPGGGRPVHLKSGDILFVPGNRRHVLHDGGREPPAPARNRSALNLMIRENAGIGERLDLLCGHFVIAPPHDRLLRSYLPAWLVVHAGGSHAETAPPLNGERTSRARVINARRGGSRSPGRSCHAKCAFYSNVCLSMRLASEADDAPTGLLALASHPRLAPTPALGALFNEPAKAWSLPGLRASATCPAQHLARQFQAKLGRTASELLTGSSG